MTAYPNRDPRSPQYRRSTTDPGGSATVRPDRDVVPITVWQLDGHDDANPNTGFAASLARRLVEIYTDPHDLVVDFDSDPNLYAATQDSNRTYQSLTGPASLGDHTGRATLVVCRWPWSARWPIRAMTLFAACHVIRRSEGCVVAVVRPTQPSYAAREHRLLSAAAASGFRRLLQIVAVRGAGTGDQFSYYATSDKAAHAVRDQPTGGRVLHIDLFGFTADRRDRTRPG